MESKADRYIQTYNWNYNNCYTMIYVVDLTDTLKTKKK